VPHLLRRSGSSNKYYHWRTTIRHRRGWLDALQLTGIRVVCVGLCCCCLAGYLVLSLLPALLAGLSFVAFRLPPPLLPLPPSSPVSAPSRSHPRFPLSLLACLQLPPAFVLLRGVDLTTFPVPAAFLHPVLRLSLSVSAHQISALPCLVCLPVCCAALRCAVRRHEPAAPSHAHSPMRRPWRRQSF
jgi:hypothetical protein